MRDIKLIVVVSLVFLATGEWAWADGDCSDNRLVQVGRIPDVIFPAGKATCVVIPPARLKVKAIADTSEGNCGLCVHVRTGWPHIGIMSGATNKQGCVASNFHTTNDPEELRSTWSGVEQVGEWHGGFTIFSDGTAGSGTIEVSTRDGNSFHPHCDPAIVDPPFPEGGHGPYPIGTFNYFVTNAVTETAFTHVVSPDNNPVPNRTVITHPLLDGQATARPIVTSVWNYGTNPGMDNNHPIGMSYGSDVPGQWSIVNLDGVAFQHGAQFNVEAAPESDDGMYVAPPVPAFRRAITIPSIYAHNPQALLFPIGGGSLPNGASSIGSTYGSTAAQWTLWNMTSTQIPDSANFFVRFIASPSPFTFVKQVQASASNINFDSVMLDNSFGLTSLSRLFASPVYIPGSNPPFNDGPIAPAPLGVWWSGNQWAIWRQDGQSMPVGATLNVYWHQPAIVADPKLGDSNGDKLADLALIGGSLSTMPIATSVGDGFAFNSPTTGSHANFVSLAQAGNGKAISGDFDGDGRNDVALTGWATIPVAFSMGDGAFRVTDGGVSIDNHAHTPVAQTSPNLGLADGDALFITYAAQLGANPVGGDFNGDGLQDIALLTVPGQSKIPIAFSRGDGTFCGIKKGVTLGDINFTSYAAQGAKVVVGDFNGDGRSDIALAGVSGWGSVPVAFSYGDGSFSGTNAGLADFPARAAVPEAKLLAGDFDGDGKADIAVVGDSSEVHIAFSNGDGSFHLGSSGYSDAVAMYANYPSVKAFAGDFDGDGKADFGLIGSFSDGYGGTFHQLLIGRSNGDGTFDYDSSIVDAQQTGDFISMMATSGAAVLSGSPGSPQLRNLARGKSASQSMPTGFGGEPGRAVDGNPSGEWNQNSVTHTDNLAQAWWQVDLGEVKTVNSVDVFNRTDCCADRLSNFYVMTSTDQVTWNMHYNYAAAGIPTSFRVDEQVRYVKIQLAGTNYLSLAEVYVWGP